MTDRALFDTNVLIYMFDNDAPAKRDIAREAFREHAKAGRAALSTQVLEEFYVVATRKLGRPLSHQAALDTVESLRVLPTIQIDADAVVAAINLAEAAQLSLWDALILQAARLGGCRVVLTEDLSHGRTIGDVEIRNPFYDAGP